jgi:DNA-binding CsgD family transcriptional regulator
MLTNGVDCSAKAAERMAMITTNTTSAQPHPVNDFGNYRNLMVETRHGGIFLIDNGREIGRVTGILVDTGNAQILLDPQPDAPVHCRTSARVIDKAARQRITGFPKNTVVRRHAQLNVQLEPLTPREREVLALIADGMSTRHIATELSIASGTVKKHIATIFGKLGVNRRTQAVAIARDLNLLQINH